jgi:DNA-binding response OmpR family regulator
LLFAARVIGRSDGDDKRSSPRAYNAVRRTGLIDLPAFAPRQLNINDDIVVLVKMARDQPYALVLMDVQLPGLDGIETTRCLRSIRSAEPVPVAAITGSGSTRSEILAAGFQDLIFKPFGRNELARVVSKRIKKGRSRRR